MAGLRAFKQPIDLSLRDSEATDEDLAVVAGLERVDELDLTGTSVTDQGLVYLRGMRGLRTLNLSRTRVTDIGLLVVGSLTGLEVLFASDTAVTDAGLAELVHLDRIHGLVLDGTRVTDEGLGYLEALPDARKWSTAVAASDDLIRWEKYPGNPLVPTAENKSSGILVDTGAGFRLYTMHPAVYLHTPAPR